MYVLLKFLYPLLKGYKVVHTEIVCKKQEKASPNYQNQRQLSLSFKNVRMSTYMSESLRARTTKLGDTISY